MAKRIYSLPKTGQLTGDQRRVLRLKKDGQYLVVGSPGTGKSVVALLRAKKIVDDDVLFLTFNHVLSHSTTQLFEDKINVQTAMSWFYSLWWKLVDGKAETFHEDKMPERDSYKPNYDVVSERFKQLQLDYSKLHIVIDEGQDLPPEWYDCLLELGCENFFIVADQNQQITEENSTQLDLMATLGLESNRQVVKLTENFRNSTPITIFANTFYTDRTSPEPVIPDRPSIYTPILYEYSTIDKIPEMILAEYDIDPSKLIGFIVPTENKREWYVKKLSNDPVPRNNPNPVVSTYSESQKGDVDIDFSYGGIVVLNDKSVKGIEFDTVFIIIDDFKVVNNDMESLKKRFYVMSSRAREKLFLFKSSLRPSVVDDILPSPGETFSYGNKNEEILKRRKL